MPGGGYPEYRCKYFYQGACETGWVYVNGGICTRCMAQGRDRDASEDVTPLQHQPGKMPREIRIPRIFEGNLQYVMMEMVLLGDSVEDWVMRQRITSAPATLPSGTSALPGYTVGSAQDL